ncbi:MAG TPA: nuclear transport factor 2 family protein [Solirubrobacteraceae bacterium]|jgi:ketosteroid isomerase-like protein|nr:nuclear transport factor 2 family protein [Solirubrobacteraceae bacterium]
MTANLDLVRSLYVAWERGDWSAVEWAHPEIEFVIADGPSPGTWSGVAGMVEGYRQAMNAWEGYSAQAEEYLSLDDERVLVLQRLSGRGKASGLELAQMQPNAAGIFDVRDGKVVKVVLYYDRDRAFADLGLAPETG